MAQGREIISVHIGQAGVQMGTSIWEQYCKEHRISLKGWRKTKMELQMERIHKVQGNWEHVPEKEQDEEKLNKHLQEDIEKSSIFFGHNQQTDTHVPRAIFVDLETSVIDEMIDSAFGDLFNSNFLICAKEDAANNYARGHYTIGKTVLDRVSEAIRKATEPCEHVQAFITNHSVAGGTGSGLAGLIAESVANNFKKIPRLAFSIYPSQYLSTAVVEPYNALLSTRDLIEFTDICVVLDNEAGYELSQKFLNIQKPSYFNVNRLVTKVLSSITSGIRFTGQQRFTVADLQTNLVPFQRLHFMTSSLAPIIATKAVHDPITEEYITNRIFLRDHMFVKYHDWDVNSDQYMGISITFRGNVNPKEANQAIQLAKQTQVKLVEWCPTGFKISLIDTLPSILVDDGMEQTERTGAMIGNNIAISRPFESRICKKYDLLYSQRAFVHWYVGEGMEEGEFSEARESLQLLLNDYQDMLRQHTEDLENEAQGQE